MNQELIITLLSTAVAVLTTVLVVLTAALVALLCYVAYLRKEILRKNRAIVQGIEREQRIIDRAERHGVSCADLR